MGASGTGILEHDLAGDVFDLYFAAFDKHVEPIVIAESLESYLAFSSLDELEKEVFSSALAECLWRTGSDTSRYAKQSRTLIDSELVKHAWGELYVPRRRVVNRMLKKIETPKAHPRNPKPARKKRQPLFRSGDHVLYRRENAKTVPLILFGIEGAFGVQYLFALPSLSNR